ncbi:MAG TPA: DUF3095 domain-containing protein [Polyangiaceae bacterium]
MALEDEQFYARLTPLERFADVTDLTNYAPAPETWLVVVTDVRGSTRAIEAGRYRDVNALGVASIIGVKNALEDLEIPFVFGGDGATLLVPGSRRQAVESALRGARQLAAEAFSLELRTSLVPVAELRAAGHMPGVARLRSGPHTVLAMLAGSAFAVAEAWVKDATRGLAYQVSAEGDSTVDFEGFECRWRPIPARRGSMTCLLVAALAADEAEQVATYQRVLGALQAIVDPHQARPVTAAGLQLTPSTGDFSVEARIRSKASAGEGFSRAERSARKQNTVGRVLTTLGVRAFGFDAKKYRSEVAENTDFRKFDATLRMVLDLTEQERSELLALLEREREAGLVVYGTHQASAALMTCLVRSYDGDHLHFIDGADGGYALAAKQMKSQLQGRGPVEN